MTAPDWYETECRIASGEYPMNEVSSDVVEGRAALTTVPRDQSSSEEPDMQTLADALLAARQTTKRGAA